MNEEVEKNGKRCCGSRWRFILIPLCAAFAIIAFGALVMYLWNNVLTDVFTSVKAITFWQAVGILLLAKILFGSFRRGCGRGCRGRGYRRGYWSHKWKNMSEEERTKLKEEWKNKCGSDKC